MIWDVAAAIQGGAVAMRVEAKTELGAVAKVMQAASDQGVAEQDVLIGFVIEHVEPEKVLVELQTEGEKTEMVARVRKGVELLNRLACDVMEAEYAGADVRLLVTAVEEAQALLTNAADAVERGDQER